MQRTIFGLFIAMLGLMFIGCPNPETPATDKTITLLAIPGVTAPVLGATPVTTAIDTEQYTGTIMWTPVASPFEANTVYTANILLTAKAGWTSSGVAANSFTVVGATATNAVNSGTVAAVFPATGAPADIDVTFSGATQVGGVSNSVSTTALTLTFSVDPSTLAASNITLTGATKGALTGTGTTRNLAISAITVANGATLSVAVTSPAGYAISGSPQTVVVYKAPTQITLLAIPGVTAPVRDATPVTTAINTAQYTGTIAWSGTPVTFAASTVYTANIELTAKAGWTLTGVAADSFTVAGATATNAVNSGTIAAVFPVTFGVDYTSPTIGNLRYVPAGSFQRDATVTNISTISTAFRMSEHEITRPQYFAIMGNDPSDPAYSSGNFNPVQRTGLYHAIAFCNKLSIAEGLTPVYAVSGVDFVTLTWMDIPQTGDAVWNAATANWSANGYRLPTEMEWMWAAMGAISDRSNGYTGTGTNTTGYTKGYAGSTETAGAIVHIGDYAWCLNNSGNKTHSVGKAGITGHPNELGLFDMSGNIIEMCWDWNAEYPAGTLTDYRGAASGTQRVSRGGSFGNIPQGDPTSSYLSVACRDYLTPGNRNEYFGFRVMRP